MAVAYPGTVTSLAAFGTQDRYEETTTTLNSDMGDFVLARANEFTSPVIELRVSEGGTVEGLTQATQIFRIVFT